MQISRDFTTILKGLAIIAIVIHNYPVISSGNVYCNEMRFSPEITEAFFNELKSPSVTIIGDFFKFIGWLGVPIFVFLSGFGLAKKYSGKGNALSVKEYLSYNYLKLLFLLLPAVIFYLAIFIATKDWQAVASSLVSLTLFGNVVNHVLPINPPVYWYFGLTWQLYLIYIVIDFISSSFSRKRLNATMLTGGGICIILQIVAWLYPDEQMLLSIFRHNFIGWLPVFFIGVWLANADLKEIRITIWVEVALMLFVVFLCCALQINFYLSLLLPFIAIIAFILLADLTSRTKFWQYFIMWIGKYSSFIFVTQTIAAGISRRLFENSSDVVLMLSYWGLTVAFALIYKILINKIRHITHI